MSLLFALSCTVVVCECMLDLFPVLHNTFITCSTKVLFVLQVMKLQQRSESMCIISQLFSPGFLEWPAVPSRCYVVSWPSRWCCSSALSRLQHYVGTGTQSIALQWPGAAGLPGSHIDSCEERRRYMKWLTKEWSHFRWVLIRSGMLFVRQEDAHCLANKLCIMVILVPYLHKKGILLVESIAGAIRMIGSSSFTSHTLHRERK